MFVARAVDNCDVLLAREVRSNFLQVRGIDMELLEANGVLKGLERVAGHAVSIPMNLILARSGRNVRHAHSLNLNEDLLASRGAWTAYKAPMLRK